MARNFRELEEKMSAESRARAEIVATTDRAVALDRAGFVTLSVAAQLPREGATDNPTAGHTPSRSGAPSARPGR